MNAHTSPHFVRTMAIVAILAGLSTIRTSRADDPNTPGDPAGLFVATWESATLAITKYNPIEDPNVDPLMREHVITVAGSVYTPDVNDLIALSTTHATALQAWDQDGNEVLFDANAITLDPGRTWLLGDEPKTFSVDLPLDPNQTVPTALLQLDFTVEALYGQPFITVDLPLDVTEEAIELLPNFHTRITEVNVTDETCSIITETTITDVHGDGTWPFDPNDRPWEETVFPSGHVLRFSDLDVISHAILVDGEGNRLPASTTRTAHSSSGTTTATTRLVLHDCPDLDDLYLRHTIAMYPYEVPIPLTVTEVTVPGL